MATKHSTIQYAAKQAYQLFLMRGLASSSIAGHFCTVWHDHVKVHGVTDARGEFCVRSVPVRKAWASL